MHSNLRELEVVTVMLTGLPLGVQLLSDSLRLRGKRTERWWEQPWAYSTQSFPSSATARGRQAEERQSSSLRLTFSTEIFLRQRNEPGSVKVSWQHRSSASSVSVHSHVLTRMVRCVYFCVCDRLCPDGSASSLQVNHNQSVESWKGVQGDLGEAWLNRCKCHEWDAPDRKACINNSVPSKSKTTKPKNVFGLLYWQCPVTYQNMAWAFAGPLWADALGPQWALVPANLPNISHWYWEKTNSNQSEWFSPAWWRALHWRRTVKKTVVKMRV